MNSKVEVRMYAGCGSVVVVVVVVFMRVSSEYRLVVKSQYWYQVLTTTVYSRSEISR
jgi:hypothetical protein